MPIQLRIYTINRGALEQWTREWEQHIKPLRLKLGFQIPAAWKVEARNQFLWLMSYDGPESWETLDKAFHESPERRGVTPDPARHIARMEHFFLTPVN